MGTELFYGLLRSIIVLFASLVPFLFVVIQQRAVWRQKDILETLSTEIQKTRMWQRAGEILGRRYFLSLPSVMTARSMPISFVKAPMFAYWASLVLVSVLMLTSWAFLLEAPLGNDWFVAKSNTLLAGPAPGEHLIEFQKKTLSYACISFCVAYIVIIYRMATRLYINQYSSIENLFDSVHLASAIIVSSIGHVVIGLLGGGDGVSGAFAFAVGLRPDFYLILMGKSAQSFLTKPGGLFESLSRSQRVELSSDLLPPDVQIQAVDGITDEVADRLKRLDIGTCHRLAFYNPLVIWARTNFSLREIVDWNSQALLILHFPEQTRKLHLAGIRTIADLITSLKMGSPLAYAAIGVDKKEADGLVARLEAMPHVADLCELLENL